MTWMRASCRAALVLLAAALAPALAGAQQQAYAAKWVNLRAGPDQGYPLVSRLPPGAPLYVQGCLQGYVWCDVVGPNNERGWLYAGNITYPYQSSNVPVIQYGAVIGFPIVSFVIGDYWGRYYPSRPWYPNINRWEHRPPHYNRPPGYNRPPNYDRPSRPPAVRPPGPPPRPVIRPPDRPGPAPGGFGPGPRPQPQAPQVTRPGGGGRPQGVGGPPPGRPGGGGPGGGRPGGGGGAPHVERPAPR